MNWFVIGNAFAPTALHTKAQGREQSEPTLGRTHHPVRYPEGVRQSRIAEVCDPFGVIQTIVFLTQGARRSAATLGCDV